MDLELQNKKIELIQWLSTLQDSSLIDKLMKIREKENSDWWGSISDEERSSIQKGIDDANEGRLIPNSVA